MTDWPIFVLSLRDAVDRRKPLVAQLDAFGLDFELFYAIDGRKGLPPHLEERIDRPQTRKNIARDMTDAEYACALSHLTIYKAVVDRDLPGAIVLEDDAILDRRFPAFYRDGAYASADLVLLDHSFSQVWRFSTRRLTSDVKMARFSLCPSLATGYSISARGCSFMIRNAFPVSRPADWPCDITQIGALAAISRLVDHPADERSDSSLETARKTSFQTRYWADQVSQTGGLKRANGSAGS